MPFKAQVNNWFDYPGQTSIRPTTPVTEEEEEEEYDDDIDLGDPGEDQQRAIDLSNCQCAEVLASVFPQLVDHWRACGNKLKTLRYLTESGAAALATSSNMQALSYLYEVQNMIEQTKKDKEPLATEEETARVQSLIGQVSRGLINSGSRDDHRMGRQGLNSNLYQTIGNLT